MTKYTALKAELVDVLPSQLPGSALDIADLKLGFMIHDVSRMRRNLFDQLMRPHGVTRSQWWVIAHLSRKTGITQTELAGLLDIGKVTLGGLVDRLETGGWVERRADSDDRRVKHVFLTLQSQLLLRQMQAIERKYNRTILKGISVEDLHTLTALLAKAKHNLLPG